MKIFLLFCLSLCTIQQQKIDLLKKVELPDYLNEKDNNARIKSPSQTEVYFWIGLFITKAQGEKNQELVKR